MQTHSTPLLAPLASIFSRTFTGPWGSLCLPLAWSRCALPSRGQQMPVQLWEAGTTAAWLRRAGDAVRCCRSPFLGALGT